MNRRPIPRRKLARKSDGKESKLSYSGNLLVENRNGLIVNATVCEANGTAERDAALVMLEQIPGDNEVTVGGDKGFDTRDFVGECRHMNVTPHVAQNHGTARRQRHRRTNDAASSYRISQQKRKRIEECFGWLKTIALLRKVRHRGLCKGGLGVHLRLRGLQPGAPAKSGFRSSGNISSGPSALRKASLRPRGHKHQESAPLNLTNDEKRKENRAADQFFSSLLGDRTL